MIIRMIFYLATLFFIPVVPMDNLKSEQNEHFPFMNLPLELQKEILKLGMKQTKTLNELYKETKEEKHPRNILVCKHFKALLFELYHEREQQFKRLQAICDEKDIEANIRWKSIDWQSKTKSPLLRRLFNHVWDTKINEAFELLLSLGADVNQSGVLGTVLISKRASVGMVQKLLDHGAVVRGDSMILWETIEYCTSPDWEEIVDLLIKYGAPINDDVLNPLELAIKSKSLKFIEKLLKHGAKIRNSSFLDTVEIKRSYPLIFAIRRNDEEWEKIVDLLIEYGADVNPPNNNGMTVLSEAIENGKSLEFIQKLIALGATVIGAGGEKDGQRLNTIRLERMIELAMNRKDEDGLKIVNLLKSMG